MSITAAEFKIRFPEFASVADATITARITMAALQVNEDLWEDLYDEGLYYLAAHFLYRSQQTASSAGATLRSVASKAVGDVSVSYEASQTTDTLESFLSSTPYGEHFMMLRTVVRIQIGVVGWDG